MRILEHLDVIDAAIGGAELVLYPALLSEHLGLNGVSGVRNLVRGKPPRAEAIERADQGNRDGSRCARRGSGRSLAVYRDAQRQVVGHPHAADGGLKERVAVPAGRVGLDGIALAVVLRKEENTLRPLFARPDLDLDLSVRVDADVKDEPVLGEPRVCPAAVVADADRRHGCNAAQRMWHLRRCRARRPGYRPRLR